MRAALIFLTVLSSFVLGAGCAIWVLVTLCPAPPSPALAALMLGLAASSGGFPAAFIALDKVFGLRP